MRSKLDVIREELARRYAAGETTNALAQSFGCSPSNMRRFLKLACGIQLRPPNRGRDPKLSPEKTHSLIRDYLNGQSANSLASKYDVSFPTVVSTLKRSGIHRRRRSQSPILNLPSKSEHLGYIAGLIDGEGSIRHWNRADGQLVVFVQITNTDSSLMEWLQKMGGNVTKEFRSMKKPKWKDCYTWKVSRLIDVLRLLEAVEPLMIIKRQKAQKAIDALKTNWFPNREMAA
jgi:hypothetical protein